MPNAPLSHPAVTGCDCCFAVVELHEKGDVEALDAHWTLNANVERPERPWFVLQLRRHCEDLSDLTGAERESLGRWLAACSDAMRALELARVYSLYLNDGGVQRHVHFHLIGRIAGERVREACSLQRPLRSVFRSMSS
jgi:diadenosine tetraphosphate (Ap4A) HIT family hydrolase